MLKEVIFFGTGTSGCVPSVHCLTAPEKTCKVCLDAMIPGSKNKRLNTSIMLRYLHPSDGTVEMNNILIDCGKTFYSQAIEWCYKYQLRKLDAVILTHSHADAMLGLDDLRQWTLNKNIQECIDVYLNENTFEAVKNVFPYLVDTSKATGGGDVAGLRFHIMKRHSETGEYEPLSINGLKVQPFDVEHGKVNKTEPYLSLGFRVENFVYISDVSKIPDISRKHLNGIDTFVLDALCDREHPSHFSIDQAIAEVKLAQPKQAFLTGFTHRVFHDDVQREVDQKTGNEGWIRLAYDGLKIEL